jgi:hypothetical protein
MKLARLCLLLLILAVPAARATILRVENETGGWDIEEVYISPAGSGCWDEDLLEPGVLPSGEGRDFEIDPGYYDVMLVDEDGDMYEMYSAFFLIRHVWLVTLDDLTGYASGTYYGGG